MSPVKQKVIDALARLPDSFTMAELIAQLEVEQGLEEAESDIAAGRVFTHDEVEQLVSEWRKSSGQTAPSKT